MFKPSRGGGFNPVFCGFIFAFLAVSADLQAVQAGDEKAETSPATALTGQKLNYPILYNSVNSQKPSPLEWASVLVPRGKSKRANSCDGNWACENINQDGTVKLIAFRRADQKFEIKLAHKMSNGRVKQLSWYYQQPLYDPKIIVKQFWSSGASSKSPAAPVYLVVAQAGGLAQEIFPVLVEHNVLNVRPLVECGYFEVAQLGKEGRPQIVTHTGDCADSPNVFDWDGNRFVESNRKHPDYFDMLVRSHAYYDDASEAEWLEYANRNEEAVAKLKLMLKNCPSDQRRELTERLKKLQETTGSQKPPSSQG